MLLQHEVEQIELQSDQTVAADAAREQMVRMRVWEIQFAQSCLDKQGAFYAFGSVLDLDGKLIMHGADPGLGEHPSPQVVKDLLIAAIHDLAMNGKVKASAVCFDATWHRSDGSKSDAIIVELEHRDCDPLRIVVPYARSESGEWQFEPEITLAGESRVFA
jgi:hypothetical protein